MSNILIAEIWNCCHFCVQNDMASSEAMTSSTHSFAYSYGLVKKCFLKICETSKFHNFLIFQPIFIRFSLFCSENFTLSSKIKLDQLRTSPLNLHWQRKPISLKIFAFPVLFNSQIHLKISASYWNVENWYNLKTLRTCPSSKPPQIYTSKWIID